MAIKEEKIRNLTNDLQKTNDKVYARDRKICDFQDAMNKNKTKKSNLNDQIKELNQQISDLNQKLQETKAELKNSKDELEFVTRAMKLVEEGFEQNKIQFDKLKNENQILIEERNDLSNDISALASHNNSQQKLNYTNKLRKQYNQIVDDKKQLDTKCKSLSLTAEKFKALNTESR